MYVCGYTCIYDLVAFHTTPVYIYEPSIRPRSLPYDLGAFHTTPVCIYTSLPYDLGAYRAT